MDTKSLVILFFGIFCLVFGGLATFGDSFTRRFVQKKNWDAFPQARKFWSDEAIYHYNRYGLGLGTFICGVIVLASLLIEYLQQ
jgi:hypothetical protein